MKHDPSSYALGFAYIVSFAAIAAVLFGVI